MTTKGEIYWIPVFTEMHPSASQILADPETYSHTTLGKGSDRKLVTLTDQTSNLGTGDIALVLNYDKSYRFANATEVSTTGITLEYPLSHYFEGISSSDSCAIVVHGRFESLGSVQHLNDAGYRAYAEAIYYADGMRCKHHTALRLIEHDDQFEREPWTQESPESWQVGGGATGNEIKFYDNDNMSTNGVFHSLNKKAIRFTPTANGEYAAYTTDIDQQDIIIDISVGVESNASESLHGRFLVFVDSQEVYSSDFYGSIQRYVLPLVNVSKLEIRIEQVGIGSPVMRIDSMALLIPLESYERPIKPDGTILIMGDSWTNEQGNQGGQSRPGFAERLRELTSALVNTDYAVGSTTIKYGWAWLPTAIDKVNPDTVVFHYGINDSNSIDGTNLSNKDDPSGTSININISNIEEYWSLVSKCVDYCVNRSIRVVFVGFPAFASTSQIQDASDQGMLLGPKKPLLIAEHIHEATDDEIRNIDSRVNVKNKYAGRSLLNVESGEVLYAAGKSPSDAWEPLRSDGSEITPV